MRAAGVVAIGVLLGSSIPVQSERDRAYGTDRPEQQILYVPSPKVMDRLVLTYDALAADVYWMRALQHFGRTRKSTGAKRYELLYPLLDTATSLDPYYNIAYRFGAIFLAEPWPGGPGRPDQALALLEKGLRASPQKWQYMQDIGFVHYWSRRDYRAAAEWFDRAGRVDGAPPFLRPLAATTLAQGGHRGASRALFESIAASGENEWMTNEARRRLQQLDTMDAIDRLTSIVALHRQRGGQPPFTWAGVIASGVLHGVPRDADGIPLELDPRTGAVTVSRHSALWPLPVEPPPRVSLP
jgi:hypothetical protein